MEANSPEATYRLFRTAQPIFKKIRFMYRSDSLYTQINYALSSFAPAFTKATEETNGYLKGADLTPEQESMLLKTILEAFGIYLSLNSVDEWPDYFEDTFSVWGGIINDMLVRNESQDAKTLIKVKKVAIDIVKILCFRHSEFLPQEYIQPFFQSIWSLLPMLVSQREFNKLIQSMIHYVSDCLGNRTLQQDIKSDLQSLFENLILKNLTFTEEDLDEFDSNEEAFIQMDLEEHDKETRRKACFQLVAKLSETWPEEIQKIVSHYQETYMDAYSKSPDREWEKMIVVLNLIIASTVTRYSFKYGATQIKLSNEDVQGYINNIIPILNSEGDARPIMKSQIIKFIMIYRNYIPHDWLGSLVEKLGSFLGNQNNVIRMYAACALEKILNMQMGQSQVIGKQDLRQGGQAFVISREVLRPLLVDLLRSLNDLITKSEGLNQYALQALF